MKDAPNNIFILNTFFHDYHIKFISIFFLFLMIGICKLTEYIFYELLYPFDPQPV